MDSTMKKGEALGFAAATNIAMAIRGGIGWDNLVQYLAKVDAEVAQDLDSYLNGALSGALRADVPSASTPGTEATPARPVNPTEATPTAHGHPHTLDEVVSHVAEAWDSGNSWIAMVTMLRDNHPRCYQSLSSVLGFDPVSGSGRRTY